MIAHTGVSVKDYKKGKRFYALVLRPLGYRLTMDFPKWKAAGYREGGHTSFWIGVPKTFAPGHIAFLAGSKAAVGNFHKAALEAGAKDNGAPGFRPRYGPTYYAAFVLDPWGNNIEACYFSERAPKELLAKKPSAKKKSASKKPAAKRTVKKTRR